MVFGISTTIITIKFRTFSSPSPCKEACSLFEDLELHPEWGGGTGGIYERLEQEHELCGQQCQNMIRTDLKRR